MAKSHSLLSQSRWEGISIDKLLHEELDPYAQEGSGISLSGPEIMLTPKSALSLSLAIHELATNAAKFGAFSLPSGHVGASWRLTADGGVYLSWREAGGPPVKSPARKGFGSTLIERALAMETGGRAELHYNPDGVACDVILPAASVLRYDTDLDLVAELAPVSAVPAAEPVAKTYRILVVEDSFLITTILQDMFDDLGWGVIGPAARVPEALLLAREESFDVALLDINLAGEMSWDVAMILKERGIPFVFSSGYGVTGAMPAELAGSRMVSKPFQLSAVEQVLRQAIDEACQQIAGA
jgi:CheY-like chemotaxis protein